MTIPTDRFRAESERRQKIHIQQVRGSPEKWTEGCLALVPHTGGITKEMTMHSADAEFLKVAYEVPSYYDETLKSRHTLQDKHFAWPAPSRDV